MISFQRPPSMSDEEVRAWIAEGTHAGDPVLALGVPAARGAVHLLQVEFPIGSIEAGQAKLAELLMDMRLLGLRPEVVRTLT